jgi:hypothetical protein
MSTRCTIGHDKNFHLYEECFDSDNVYLELEGDKHGIELEHFGNTKSVIVSIDVSTWRKIVESWMSSEWCSRPERDYKTPEIDVEYFNRLIENRLREVAKKELKDGDKIGK